MTNRHSIAFYASAAACLIAISCASQAKVAEAPEPASAAKPAEAEVVSAANADPTAAAPDELRAKASALRKKAFDLALKDFAPEEYAAADKAFATGNAEYGKDNAASAASYSEAAAGFQAVLDRGLPLLAASERQRAEARRDEAMAAHAEELFSETFAYAGDGLAKSREAEAGADFEIAVAAYRSSAGDFYTLRKLCDARSAREYLESHDLAKWDPSDWNLAENKYKAAQELFKSDAKASRDSADEAVLRYGIARSAAMEYYAGDRKKASEAERERASLIKSEVAAKDEYLAAQVLFADAEAEQADKDYESSSSLYDRAASAFTAAYSSAKLKMDAAKGELDSLDLAIASKSAKPSISR
jgi:hypothetical protein